MEKKIDVVYNPLCSGKWANKPCVCGSGKKIKKCHGQYRAIPIEMKRDLDNILPEYKNLLELKRLSLNSYNKAFNRSKELSYDIKEAINKKYLNKEVNNE